MERIPLAIDMDLISFEDQCDLSRSLKGAPASILLALLLSGRILTAEQLGVATSYSDKPIRKALILLESYRFVKNNGRLNGWSLGPDALETLKPALSWLLHSQPQRWPVSMVTTRPQRDRQSEIITPSSGGLNGCASELISNRNTRVEYRVALQSQDIIDRRNSEQAQQPRRNSEQAQQPRRNSEQAQQPRRNTEQAQSQPRRNSEQAQSQPRRNTEQAQSQPRRNSEQAQPQPRKNSEQSSENLRTSGPADQISSDAGSDLLDGLYKPLADQQQPDLLHGNRKNSELAQLLSHVEISEPAFSRILETYDTALVLAWWWLSFEKKWLDNPNGWLIRRLEYQDRPRAPYLELAKAWLALDKNEKSEMRSACFIHGDLERFWRDRGLSRKAVHVLTPIHRSGGFKVFDDDE